MRKEQHVDEIKRIAGLWLAFFLKLDLARAGTSSNFKNEEHMKSTTTTYTNALHTCALIFLAHARTSTLPPPPPLPALPSPSTFES